MTKSYGGFADPFQTADSDKAEMMRNLWGFAILFCTLAASSATLSDRVVGISDCDTITVLVDRQPVKVRLTEIDTPEKAQPWGSRSKDALSGKVFGKEVEVRNEGTDHYGRTLGRVFIEGRDVNREMTREGHAWAYRRYLKDQSLLAEKEYARANHSACGASQRRSGYRLGSGGMVAGPRFRRR